MQARTGQAGPMKLDSSSGQQKVRVVRMHETVENHEDESKASQHGRDAWNGQSVLERRQ